MEGKSKLNKNAKWAAEMKEIEKGIAALKADFEALKAEERILDNDENSSDADSGESPSPSSH